ncbi:MAG: hypothetical protein PHO75_00280 [Candidatus Shapirobacteria bacterium]|jgi:hypothetical protein|nr:hypothetical protein [Candidatus Shapirobacteria bacterium]
MSKENYKKAHYKRNWMPNLVGHQQKKTTPRVVENIEKRTIEFNRLFFSEIKPEIEAAKRKNLDQL